MYLIYPFTPGINCTCEFFNQPTTGAKDLSIFETNIPLLNKFLKHFASCFSKKQMAMFTLAIYALFKDYNGCSPQGEKQKCLKSLTVTGLYAEREVFFS